MADNRSVVLDGFEVKLRVPLAVFLVAAVVVLSIMFALENEWRPLLIFVAASVGGAATVFSGYYIATGVHVQAKQQTMQNTFSLLRELDDLSFLEVRSRLDTLLDSGGVIPPAELVGKIKGDLALYAGARGLLNTLEDIAVGIQQGYVDEVVAQQSICTLLLWTITRLNPFIDAQRKFLDNDSIYCEVLKLQAAWREKKYLSTGKRFDT